jgi:hypothetical protein
VGTTLCLDSSSFSLDRPAVGPGSARCFRVARPRRCPGCASEERQLMSCAILSRRASLVRAMLRGPCLGACEHLPLPRVLPCAGSKGVAWTLRLSCCHTTRSIQVEPCRDRGGRVAPMAAFSYHCIHTTRYRLRATFWRSVEVEGRTAADQQTNNQPAEYCRNFLGRRSSVSF